jgi:hypothetical protein
MKPVKVKPNNYIKSVNIIIPIKYLYKFERKNEKKG